MNLAVIQAGLVVLNRPLASPSNFVHTSRNCNSRLRTDSVTPESWTERHAGLDKVNEISTENRIGQGLQLPYLQRIVRIRYDREATSSSSSRFSNLSLFEAFILLIEG